MHSQKTGPYRKSTFFIKSPLIIILLSAIAAALILKGISPGAALVFLMTGPATNAATFTTIWKVLGSTTAVIYLATVAGCALAAALFLITSPPVLTCTSEPSVDGCYRAG